MLSAARMLTFSDKTRMVLDRLCGLKATFSQRSGLVSRPYFTTFSSASRAKLSRSDKHPSAAGPLPAQHAPSPSPAPAPACTHLMMSMMTMSVKKPR